MDPQPRVASTARTASPWTIRAAFSSRTSFHNRIRKVASNQATLLFDAMRVGRVSTPKTQILENDGNSSLTPQALTAVTNSQIDLPNTTCSSSLTLAPLETCVISAAFAPTVVGNPTLGTLNLTSSAADPVASLVLAGQVLDVDPSTIVVTSSANPSATGAPVTFTVTVTSAGTTPTGNVTLLDGTVVLGVSSLQAGGKTSFTVSTLAWRTALHHRLLRRRCLELLRRLEPARADRSGRTSSYHHHLASSAASIDAGALSGSPPTWPWRPPVRAPARSPATSPSRTERVSWAPPRSSPVPLLSASPPSRLARTSITAAYLGNTTYASSTSAALAETVTWPPPTSRSRRAPIPPTRARRSP